MKTLIIRSHLGLGDMLIINAIVRDRAGKFEKVFLPCKEHNVPSVGFMFRDLPSVYVLGVKDDYEADLVARKRADKGTELLGLGMFGSKPFNIDQWDKEMYRQAGVPFEDRWGKFKLARCKEREQRAPSIPWSFVHEDAGRGFLIRRDRLPQNLIALQPTRSISDTIFDFWSWIEKAEHIACIDSVFAILADSIPTEAQHKALHLYARPNAKPPTYRSKWEVWK